MELALVIEDNFEVRENTAEILEVGGYKVMTAENGREGFDCVLKYKPDIIICDMMMPDADGSYFLKLMKANESTCRIPIIFFSAGSPSAKVCRNLMELGNDYLPKPFTKNELLEKVTKFI